MKADSSARIVRKESWGPYVLFGVESPLIARSASPGQFVMVKASGSTAPLLRRPLSLSGRQGDRILLFLRVAGQGTALLAEKEPEDRMDIIGPLGRGFKLPGEAPSAGASLLVGGGRGIAPIHFLARDMQAGRFQLKVLYGGRTASDLPLREHLQAGGLAVSCSTDDGSLGFRGLVTGLLKKEVETSPAAAIYACGPEPMLREVAGIAAAARLPAQLSLESHMGCGFGACWGCVKKINRDGRESFLKVCEEGPVFPAEEVVWT